MTKEYKLKKLVNHNDDVVIISKKEVEEMYKELQECDRLKNFARALVRR